MLGLTKNDIATVALWLGHESMKSTEVYLHSNTTIKQEAIDKVAPIDTPPGRYKPTDKLLAFLESSDQSRSIEGIPAEDLTHAAAGVSC